MVVSLVLAATIYAWLGLLFGLAFVTYGVTRVDTAARGTGWGFRLLILPGVVALWPLLLRRWLQGAAEPPVETNADRRLAKHG
jgi:hypothetical protein